MIIQQHTVNLKGHYESRTTNLWWLTALVTKTALRVSYDRSSAPNPKPRVCESMLFNNSCRLPNCKYPHDRESLEAARAWYGKALSTFNVDRTANPPAKALDVEASKPPWTRPAAPGSSTRELRQVEPVPSDICTSGDDEEKN